MKRLWSGWLLGLLACWALLPVPVQAQTWVEYVHTDALGSVVALTDERGQVIERREYEPYGQQLTPAVQDGPGYTGHVQDAATGLTYMQQRYYDPQLGLFLSFDPVTAYSNPVGQFNRYRYANNNPFKFIDPDGRLGCAASRIASICESHGMVSTSVRSPLDTGRYQQSSRGTQPSGPASTTSNAGRTLTESSEAKRFSASSIFTGDSKPTFTYGAAFGSGLKAEFKEGEADRYSLVTPALGGQASGTWNILTLNYNFMPDASQAPVSAGLNIAGRGGAGFVGGFSFRYTPPGSVSLNFNGGLGIAASVELFEVSVRPEELEK